MLAALSACQPTLNWREARPAGSGAAALFPCKPEVEQRPAQAGQGAMGLAQCDAAGRRFSLSWADVPDASQADAALKAMSLSLAGKLGQPLPVGQAVQVPGMTPLPDALQHRLGGRGMARMAVFAHGGRVYQALLTGENDDAAAWDAFLGGLRVGSAAEAGR